MAPSIGLAALASLAIFVEAERAVVEIDSHSDGPQDAAARINAILYKPGNMVCGSTELKDLLMSQKDEKEMRLFKWKRVEAIADDYLARMDTMVPNIEANIKTLSADLEKKLKSAEQQNVADDQIKGVIEGAIKAQGSFGDVAVAKDCACKRNREVAQCKKLKTSMLKAASAKFTEATTALLQAQKVRAEQTHIQQVCNAQLVKEGEKDLDGNQCFDWCKRVSIEGAKISNQLVGAKEAGASSTAVAEKLDKLRVQLEEHKFETEECKEARATMIEFNTQLKDLNADIQVKFDASMEADDALKKAERQLDLLEEHVAKQEAFATQALTLVQGNTAAENAAKAALTEVQSKGQTITTKSKAVELQLKNAKMVMSNVMESDKVLTELKGLVAAFALAVDNHVNEMVREPVANMCAMTAEHPQEVDESFPDLKQLPQAAERYLQSGQDSSNAPGRAVAEAATFRSAVRTLHTFCKEEALPVFEEVQKAYSTVDMRPLCTSLPSAPDIVKSIDDAVVLRKNTVLKSLQQVQLALDPLKNMKKKNIEKFKEEPDGLRKIVDLLRQKDFYKNYLKNWEFSGAFIKMMKQLKASIKSLSDEQDKNIKVLEDLKQMLAINVQAQTAASAQLEKATAASKLASDKLKVAQDLLAKEKSNAVQQRTDFEELERLAKEALEKYHSARDKLQQTFKLGTGKTAMIALNNALLELFEEHEAMDSGEAAEHPIHKISVDQ